MLGTSIIFLPLVGASRGGVGPSAFPSMLSRGLVSSGSLSGLQDCGRGKARLSLRLRSPRTCRP